jgi:hypothetical protein
MGLKLHVLSRNAYDYLEQKRPEFHTILVELRNTHRVEGEDVEVISIALLVTLNIRSQGGVELVERG